MEQGAARVYNCVSVRGLRRDSSDNRGSIRMAATGVKTRSPWTDRFRSPAAETLIDGLHRQHIPAFGLARARLAAMDGLREVIAWHGVWNWTLEFHGPASGASASAYLIPDPDKPRLCVPIAEHRLATLSPKKYSKSIRDAILHAPAVNGDRWPIWAIQTKAQIDELLQLVEVRAVVVTTVAPVPA